MHHKPGHESQPFLLIRSSLDQHHNLTKKIPGVLLSICGCGCLCSIAQICWENRLQGKIKRDDNSYNNMWLIYRNRQQATLPSSCENLLTSGIGVAPVEADLLDSWVNNIQIGNLHAHNEKRITNEPDPLKVQVQTHVSTLTDAVAMPPHTAFSLFRPVADPGSRVVSSLKAESKSVVRCCSILQTKRLAHSSL